MLWDKPENAERMGPVDLWELGNEIGTMAPSPDEVDLYIWEHARVYKVIEGLTKKQYKTLRLSALLTCKAHCTG